uniref:Ribosome biogenesis protein SLX9 n=1 Tax=Phaeocystis antarctica TaxID=33657 RepID=A0A7S0HUC4_9EUKA|eukprot:scaffold10931_cov75-Phaeocystis_antarctica.AAC.4
MGKGHNAKGATGKKKKPLGSKSKADQPRSIEKRKHARGDSDGKRKLVQKLQADAPPRKAVQKQKQKRAANAGVLGAVAGLRGSLDDLIHASEERVRERAAAAEGAEKASKKSMSSKRRQQLVVDETQHMQEVLSHPSFIANPFAALQEHLSNTVTAPASKEKLKERGSKSDRRYMQDE